MAGTMADEESKAILGPAKLVEVEHGIGLLDAGTSSLAAIMQPDSDTQTLLAIARRMEDFKGLLLRLRDALKKPCTCHPLEAAPDLQMCMASCQLVAERLVSLAYAAAETDDNDTDSQLTLLDNAAVTDGDDLRAIDEALEDIGRALTLVGACKCTSTMPHRRSGPGRMLASPFRGYFKKAPLLPSAARRLKLAAVKMATTLTNFRPATSISGLTPRCIAHKRAADAARRRSMAIDEQIAADSEQQLWMVPLYGSQEERTLVLGHFIARVPDTETPSSPAATDAVRRHILKDVLSLSTTLADHDCCYRSTDRVTNATVSRVQDICAREDLSRLDERFAEDVKFLWSHPSARGVLMRHLYSSEAHGNFLVQAVERASKPGYQPTTRDCHRFAVDGGLALHQGSFNLEGMNVSFVNAHRWPRKSLEMHDCPCIVYVADLSSYAREGNDGPGTTALQDSIHEFGHLLCSKHYKNTSSILILTNLARFRESLQTKPLSDSFPEFQADQDPEAAVNHVLQKFTAAKLTRNEIYVHIGEITDATMFDFIAGATRDCLLKRAADRSLNTSVCA